MAQKKVPVVVYINGDREVVGEAVISQNGSFVAIAAQIDGEVASKFFGEVTQVSMSSERRVREMGPRLGHDEPQNAKWKDQDAQQ